MMTKLSILRFYLTITAFALILGGCSLLPTPQKALPIKQVQESGLPKQALSINGISLVVEVASTESDKAHGLSGRQSLPEGTGMLFLFDRLDRYSFWMNDMKFALDFIWLNQGQIVEITPQVPAPSAQDPVPAAVRPSREVSAVIEVPAGWTAKNNIAVGDEVMGLTR
jgi:uncharacterized membrane protein (UPF0127 family)